MTNGPTGGPDVALVAAGVMMPSSAALALVPLLSGDPRSSSLLALGVLAVAFLLALGRGPFIRSRAASVGVLALAGTALQLAIAPPRSESVWVTFAVASVALLMIRRRQSVLGWIVLAVPVALVIVVRGLGSLHEVGVVLAVPTVALVAASLQVTRAYASRLEAYAVTEREAIEWRVAQDAYQVAHQERIERTGRLADEMLQRIVDADGDLDPDDRVECRLLHQSIRDETRGRHLLNDAVRAQVLAHRRCGAAVDVLDDGQLGDTDSAALDTVLDEIAAALADLRSDRIVIRAAGRDAAQVVSIVATSSDPVAAALGREDDERLDLRLERRLPRLVAGASAP